MGRGQSEIADGSGLEMALGHARSLWPSDRRAPRTAMMERGILAAAHGPHPFASVAVARHRVDTVEAQHGANSFTMFCGLKGTHSRAKIRLPHRRACGSKRPVRLDLFHVYWK